MAKEIKGTKRNHHVINDLTMFSENGGFIVSGVAPKRNEPFYSEYMIYRLKEAGVTRGTILKLKAYDSDTLVEGTLLVDIYPQMSLLEILIKGHKPWKNGQNKVHVSLIDIEDFDVIGISDFIKPLEKFNHDDLVNSTGISEVDSEIILSKYPDADMEHDVFLNITADIFCQNESPKYKTDDTLISKALSAEIVIANNDGNVTILDKLSLKRIYPNKDYISLCENGDNTGNVILHMDKSQLTNISYVACTWKLDVNGDEVKIMHLVYPSFEECEYGCIYNVNLRAVPLNEQALSLHKKTVFSGETYTDYDCVGLSLAGEKFIIISGDINQHEVMDVGLALHKGSVEEIIEQTCHTDYKEYAEVYIQKVNIGANSWLSSHTMAFDIKKKSVDFSKINK